jgi:hypothetical protein
LQFGQKRLRTSGPQPLCNCLICIAIGLPVAYEPLKSQAAGKDNGSMAPRPPPANERPTKDDSLASQSQSRINWLSLESLDIKSDEAKTSAVKHVETLSEPRSRSPSSRGNLSSRENTSAGAMEQRLPPQPVSEYKTYKRRWFGLFQLILLNIVVSWDVGIPEAPIARANGQLMSSISDIEIVVEFRADIKDSGRALEGVGRRD